MPLTSDSVMEITPMLRRVSRRFDAESTRLVRVRGYTRDFGRLRALEHQEIQDILPAPTADTRPGLGRRQSGRSISPTMPSSGLAAPAASRSMTVAGLPDLQPTASI